MYFVSLDVMVHHGPPAPESPAVFCKGCKLLGPAPGHQFRW